MNGRILKIQGYSTKDGPGIRSTVFAVGCPLRCRWCANPELVYCDFEETGYTIAAEELTSKLLRDKAFYDRSDGGVTFSGGEPVLQAEFFVDVAERLKAASVHVALDTSGYIKWEKLAPLVSTVDLVLYDIRLMSNEMHIEYTETDNQPILENARKIAETGTEMIVRLILIPGINDTERELVGRLEFIRGLGVKRVDLLKYHKLGVGKYVDLGLAYPMENTPECSDEKAKSAAKKAADMGFEVTIGGA
jgi:pyruvate formate lyase activating enzyme